MTWCIFVEGDKPVAGVYYNLYWFDPQYRNHDLMDYTYYTKQEAVRKAVSLWGKNGRKIVHIYKKKRRDAGIPAYERVRY